MVISLIEPRESAVELRRPAHVNNVIHCLLMTTATDVYQQQTQMYTDMHSVKKTFQRLCITFLKFT